MAEIVHAVEIAYEGTPLDRFARFANAPYAALLDSAKVMDRSGRYSFLAVDPFSVLEAKDGRVTLDGRSFAGDPFAVMAERLAAFPMTHRDGLPPSRAKRRPAETRAARRRARRRSATRRDRCCDT